MNTLSLKWGTLKEWSFDEGNDKSLALLNEYHELGASWSAFDQNDTPRQKEIICNLIDLSDEIWLDWDGKKVTKKKAKEYIANYGKRD